MWYLIVSVPDHCLSFPFTFSLFRNVYNVCYCLFSLPFYVIGRL